MKSMPASSAIMASFLLSGQLPDQRSGTKVTARPDEQFGPNRPICSLLPEYIERRDCREACGASTGRTFSCSPPPCGEGWGSGGYTQTSKNARAPLHDFISPRVPHPSPSTQGGGEISWIECRAHPRHHLGRRMGERRDRCLDLLSCQRIHLEADLGGVRDKTFVLHGGIEGAAQRLHPLRRHVGRQEIGPAVFGATEQQQQRLAVGRRFC